VMADSAPLVRQNRCAGVFKRGRLHGTTYPDITLC
jgi:hypothetical protein